MSVIQFDSLLKKIGKDMLTNKKVPVLTHNQLVYYGNACGMKTVPEVLANATLLHECGRIIYMRNHPWLKDYAILDPGIFF